MNWRSALGFVNSRVSVYADPASVEMRDSFLVPTIAAVFGFER